MYTLNRALKCVGFIILLSVSITPLQAHNTEDQAALEIAQEIYRALEPYILTFDIDAQWVGQKSVGTPKLAGKKDLILKISKMIKSKKTLKLLSLSFPFKSGNRSKLVLSDNPDMAEVISLSYLHKMVKDIQRVYADVSLTILTDGLLFNDLFHISEESVEKYESVLEQIVTHFPGIKLLTLSSFLKEKNIPLDVCRKQANSTQLKTPLSAKSLDLLKQRIQIEIDHKDHPYSTLTPRAQKQELEKIAQTIAKRDEYLKTAVVEVVQDSNTLRVSMHYQPNIANKVGIKLTPDSLYYPWNGVPIETKEGELKIIPKYKVDLQHYSLHTTPFHTIPLSLYRWK